MRALWPLPFAIASAIAPGCAGRATPTTPAETPTPSASASASTSASASAPAVPFDPDALAPVLVDPRAADAATHLAHDDPGGTARSLDAVLATMPADDPARARFVYAAARYHQLAREGDLAARGFLSLREAPTPLAPYARLHAAEEAIRAGRLDEGKDLASSIPDDMPIISAARLLIAEVLERKNDGDGALVILRAHLANSTGKKPSQWTSVSIRAARILVGKNDPTAAEEALHLARTVSVSVPRGPAAEQAHDLASRALTIIPSPRREQLAPLSPDEEEQMLRALMDVDAAAADVGAKDLESRLTVEERAAEVGCRVATLTAQIKTKRRHKNEADEAWGVAIDRCAGDAKVFAAFQGGKAARSNGRTLDAMARFDQVEALGPKSRYADDARVLGADAARVAGDEQRFSQRLERIADDYPDGDMTTDGLFRLAFFRLDAKDDWAGAVAPLARALQLRPRERVYWAAGRTPYFLARAKAQTGDKQGAAAGYAGVIRDYPFTYYMLEAHARLAEIDPEAAAKALADARANPTPFAVADDPALHGPAFARITELLAVGDVDAAKAEANALGLTRDDAKAELLWALSLLYAQAGDFRDAHAVPRGRLTDWLDHYPEGTWRRAWEIAYPRPYLDLVSRSAKSAGISSSFAYAIMREESAFDPQVVSAAKAYGLMQLILPTAKTLAKKAGVPVSESLLKTPETNVPLGCRYLGMLRGTFPSCPVLAIPAYNAGAGAPKKWLDQRPDDELDRFVERIPYEETRNYTKRVLQSYAAYLALYEPQGLDEVLRLPRKPQGRAALPPAPPASDDPNDAATPAKDDDSPP